MLYLHLFSSFFHFRLYSTSRISDIAVPRFLMNWGSKLELRSRGVETVTSLNEIWTCFCILPLRQLPMRSFSVRWASISPSRVAFNMLSSKGAKAPSLPDNGLPSFSCSIALFLMLSKSNSSFIKKTVLAKLIIYSLLTQFNLHPQIMGLNSIIICFTSPPESDYRALFSFSSDSSFGGNRCFFYFVFYFYTCQFRVNHDTSTVFANDNFFT